MGFKPLRGWSRLLFPQAGLGFQPRHGIVLFSLCLCQGLLYSAAFTQTVAVGGTVSTSATTVRNASVSFEDTENPARLFSTVTDSTGNYSLAINLTSIGSGTPLPLKFELEQNYPNPFSTSTAISYKLPIQSDIRVTVYDILGRVVREARVGAQAAGTHSILWDGTNARGHRVAPGVYFYSLQAGGETHVRKMVLRGGSGPIALPEQTSLAPVGRASGETLHRGWSGNFTVRIENTGTTFPLIVTAQFDDVIVQSDTTLDFPVENRYPVPVTTVYPDSLLQYIRGFGGANIIPWRPAMTDDQMQKAFGAGEGELGFTILRLRVPYTDNAGEFAAQLSVAQLAQSRGTLVFASPWTPPPALKSNNNIVGGVLNDTSYASYAAHLKNFADYMAANGVPLYGVSVQNEPDASVTYESCSWDAAQLRKFMKNNAPAIGTRVMMPESMNFARALSDSTLNDSTAAANTAIIAGHLYGGGLSVYPLAVSKGKEVWMTEYLDLDTTWTAVLGTGKQIHDCMTVGWNAYVWWYIVRYYGPISEDGNVSKRGYVMSQYSRFVRPGLYRVKCNATPQRSVYVTSYRDMSSSRMVLVALNLGAAPLQQAFALPGVSATALAPYTTSATKNCVQGGPYPVTNGTCTATLEPSSITTFLTN